MPKITAIDPQKKNHSRFNVYLDGNFGFGVNSENLLKYQLRLGKELNDNTINQISKEEQVASLINQSLNFLSYRPRSQKEVEDYLAKKISQAEGVKFKEAQTSPIITLIVKRLKKYKYLDDLEFAKWWVESRLRSKPRGPKFIKMELRQKKIGDEIIEDVLKKIKNQEVLAAKSIEKKLPKWERLSEIEFKKKVFTFLLSKGFDRETISQTIAFLVKKR